MGTATIFNPLSSNTQSVLRIHYLRTDGDFDGKLLKFTPFLAKTQQPKTTFRWLGWQVQFYTCLRHNSADVSA